MVAWDGHGRLRDPQKNATIMNSSILNIVKNIFDPNSAYNQKHMSVYIPTGINDLLNKHMRLKGMALPDQTLAAIHRNMASGNWTMRECNGRVYNLVRMFGTFVRWMPFIIMYFGSISTFVLTIMTLTGAQFSWIAWLFDWLTAAKLRDPTTNALVQTVGNGLNVTRHAVPGSMHGMVDTVGNMTAQAFSQDDGTMSRTVWTLGVGAAISIATSVATFVGSVGTGAVGMVMNKTGRMMGLT
jgi:hypothetical protein